MTKQLRKKTNLCYIPELNPVPSDHKPVILYTWCPWNNKHLEIKRTKDMISDKIITKNRDENSKK
jgi:hypothetical protein